MEHHRALRHDIGNHAAVVFAALDLEKVSDQELRNVVRTRMASIMSLADKMRADESSPSVGVKFDVNKSVIAVEETFVCFPRAVTFRSSYQPTSLRACGDHTEFERALVNIIENACSAVGQSENPQIDIATKSGTDSIEITIGDNGHGMEEEVRVQIFKSGFTTKRQSSNHGLGLSITAKIVDNLGGTILCESAPQNGATFRISLPAS